MFTPIFDRIDLLKNVKMKIHYLPTLILGAALFASCGDNPTHGDADIIEDETMEHHHDHHDGDSHEHIHMDDENHTGDGSTVQLNDGETWEANPETTTGIKNMQELINDFDPGAERAEYVALHDHMDREFKTIFAKCTMTGEAHNQLHNYLHPMREWIDGLMAEDDETRHHSLEKLNARLDEYPRYFHTEA